MGFQGAEAPCSSGRARIEVEVRAKGRSRFLEGTIERKAKARTSLVHDSSSFIRWGGWDALS
jgi:hypothetical protein